MYIQVLNPENEKIQLLGQADRLNSREAKLKFSWKGNDVNSKQLGKTNYKVYCLISWCCQNFEYTLQNVVDKILDIASQSQIDFVGHRVVHGGELFRDVTEITEESLKDLRKIEGKGPSNMPSTFIFSTELAPLHNPVQINVIRQTIKR